ncbi:calcineurin-like phosphoesterase C-terminal domain-containing protein [Methylocella sp.]|uniref:calcineurin-like phosphoesterase C-terminal domain-containing protein n=1 Tax=Methylocella sp. TaxID=1978226 RepID=UPI003782E25E
MRRQPRRQPQRLSCAVGRRRGLSDPFRPGERAGRPTDADHGRRRLPPRKGALSRLPARAAPLLADFAGGRGGRDATLVVNFFDGGPRTRLSYRIGDGAARPMARVARTDPHIEELYGRYASTIKPWVRPAVSSHVWTARLPAGLAPGAHRLTVEAVDEYGRSHVGRVALEITA